MDAFVNLQASGDLFMWSRCWYPSKIDTYTSGTYQHTYVNDSTTSTTAATSALMVPPGESLLQLRRPVSVDLAAKLLKLETATYSSSLYCDSYLTGEGQNRPRATSEVTYTTSHTRPMKSTTLTPVASLGRDLYKMTHKPLDHLPHKHHQQPLLHQQQQQQQQQQRDQRGVHTTSTKPLIHTPPPTPLHTLYRRQPTRPLPPQGTSINTYTPTAKHDSNNTQYHIILYISTILLILLCILALIIHIATYV